ncbi:hypothetical protein CDEST_15566 [Colletotrichum destructivum]|uniref:Uncharacterized protein n=1 Tax=Colletotrichum destructivum TaxID=34406 RepID=A0AAX4J5D2_9PEZI|nr:hypothetical protein CDEST_15566 [Colletotrichum destructivum]
MAFVREIWYLRAIQSHHDLQSRPTQRWIRSHSYLDYLRSTQSHEAMAPVASDEIVFIHDKKAKEKVRKCGGSAKRKAVQLGKGARVFSAVVHFNPTYGELDGAVYVPQGQSIPDVNQFVTGGTHQRHARNWRSTSGHTPSTGEDYPEPSQTTVEASDNKVGELTDSATGAGDASAAEDAEGNEITNEGTNEVTNGDSDAPHEVEAIDNGVADDCGIGLDDQQDEARWDQDPTNPAQQKESKETALFNEGLNDKVEDFVMVDTDTTAETKADEEASFIALLEVGMHDLFEVEAETTSRLDLTGGVCLPASGPVDNSGQEERPNATMPGWESMEVKKTKGDAVMENTAEANEEAPGHEPKTQKTPTAAVARDFRTARNTQKIHRFFWQVSKQIRLARRQGDLDIGQFRQIRLGVKAVREVRATVQSRGNRNVRPAYGPRNPPPL